MRTRSLGAIYSRRNSRSTVRFKSTVQIVSSTAGRLEAKAARAPGELPSWAKAQARAKRADCGLCQQAAACWAELSRARGAAGLAVREARPRARKQILRLGLKHSKKQSFSNFRSTSL